MKEPFATLPAEAIAAEKEYIDAWRMENLRLDNRPLTGLALSGGGIRSAVFCLGVIQALAKHKVLKNFDFMSTVSGGGYIGASLTWFTRSETAFGVNDTDLPYGIDDPVKTQPDRLAGTNLLSYLRRHGSYLDPGGTTSLLAGVAVVLRGLLLNLIVVWLPIITALLTGLRIFYRWVATATETANGSVRLRPLALATAFFVIFTILALGYSVYSGWRAKKHKDMPYQARRCFERVAPWVLTGLAISLILGSLPYVRDMAILEVSVDGPLGLIMTVGGTLLGLWSRLVPKGDAAATVPAWAGPIGAAFLVYGILLLGYFLSGLAFAGAEVTPNNKLGAVIGTTAILAVFFGTIVNLNETTLHRFYRDRIMEAFMPDMLSGGVPMENKATAADTGLLSAMCDQAKPKAPYHLINAHLILTRIGKAALPAGESVRSVIDRYRIRGGDSFVFAPRYSGGTAAGWHDTKKNKTLSMVSLATAMAVSGAAVNPDAASAGVGPQRSLLFATLMALLNIRLGYWLPNPKRYSGKLHAPAPNHFNAGLAGILNYASQTSRFLEIADGGNFENLGVYELLRRQVQTIVVCDATADPTSAFQDLQNLLNLAEADFGVQIIFDPPPLGALMPALAAARFPLGVAFAKQPFVTALIQYPGATGHGKLYYVKPAIFAGLRLELLGFKGANPAFPDDSTINQFFDEARFEAYRELGFACVDKMLENPGIGAHLAAM